MNRRGFLKLLGFGTVAAAAASTELIDVEKLLWTPGEKTIFIPDVCEGVWCERCQCFHRPHGTVEDEYIRPAAEELAQRIDDGLVQLYGNQIETPDWVAKEYLRTLQDKLDVAKHINRGYDQTLKVGDTVRVRLPMTYEVPAIGADRKTLETITLTLDHFAPIKGRFS